MPWTAAYVDSRGEPTADLRSNMAAEARTKIMYERLINITDDPGVKDALGFLMTREVAHQKSFENALQAIENTFPPGKMPGMERFANTYYDMSQDGGAPAPRGPWNQGGQWEYVDDREAQAAVDGGDGQASVQLDGGEQDANDRFAARTRSKPDSDLDHRGRAGRRARGRQGLTARCGGAGRSFLERPAPRGAQTRCSRPLKIGQFFPNQ